MKHINNGTWKQELGTGKEERGDRGEQEPKGK